MKYFALRSLLAAFICTTSPAHAQRSAVEKADVEDKAVVEKKKVARPVWEYRVKFVHRGTSPATPDQQKALNALGAEGWELVSVQPYGDPGHATIYYLKRLKAPEVVAAKPSKEDVSK